MEIQIRETKKSDIKSLSRIYKNTYDADSHGEKWSLQQAEQLIKFYFNQKNFIGLTALCDGKICGAFLSYIKPWWDGNHLAEGELFVAPAYQKQSIGTKLFLSMMKIANRKKCTTHELIAYGKPGTWYKKIGFKETKLKHLSGSIKKSIDNLSK